MNKDRIVHNTSCHSSASLGEQAASGSVKRSSWSPGVLTVWLPLTSFCLSASPKRSDLSGHSSLTAASIKKQVNANKPQCFHLSRPLWGSTWTWKKSSPFVFCPRTVFLKQLKAKRLPGDTAAHLYAGLHECVKLDTANTTFEII